MTKQHPITEVLLALLNIQNNLSYIDKELDVLKIDEADRTSIKQIISRYFAILYDCQEELVALRQNDGVITIDPLLNEITDDKTQADRATLILNTLHQHNALLTHYTDSLIIKRDKIASDTEYGAFMVLMTESVGNILYLSHVVSASLTPLTTNK